MVFYKQYSEHGVSPVCIKIQGDTMAKAFPHGQPLMYKKGDSFFSELYSPACDFSRKLNSNVSVTTVQSRFFT